MLGYSKIQIMGNVGATPDFRVLPSGDHVVNFSVAVTRRFKDREDHPKEVTDWFRITAFNGIGSACANHLQTGDGVFVVIFVPDWEHNVNISRCQHGMVLIGNPQELL